jgi:hypothetical protein
MNQELITQQLEQESQPLIIIANEVQIQTKDDVLVASQDLSNIQTTLKAIEKKRKEFVDPLNESLKAINSSFKKLSEPLEKAKAILSGKITDWHIAEQKRIAEENERIRKEEEKRRKIQEAHAAQGHEVSKPVEMKREAPIENKIGSTYMRTDWDWEIINIGDIPKEYLTLNSVKINTAVRAGVRSIPGIRIYEVQKAVTR